MRIAKYIPLGLLPMLFGLGACSSSSSSNMVNSGADDAIFEGLLSLNVSSGLMARAGLSAVQADYVTKEEKETTLHLNVEEEETEQDQPPATTVQIKATETASESYVQNLAALLEHEDEKLRIETDTFLIAIAVIAKESVNVQAEFDKDLTFAGYTHIVGEIMGELMTAVAEEAPVETLADCLGVLFESVLSATAEKWEDTSEENLDFIAALSESVVDAAVVYNETAEQPIEMAKFTDSVLEFASENVPEDEQADYFKAMIKGVENSTASYEFQVGFAEEFAVSAIAEGYNAEELNTFFEDSEMEYNPDFFPAVEQCYAKNIEGNAGYQTGIQWEWIQDSDTQCVSTNTSVANTNVTNTNVDTNSDPDAGSGTL